MDAIQSATSRAAVMLDMEGKLGVIAPGAFADVIAVGGDPLGDIKVLGNVQFVMKDGQVFRNDIR
jgi:imidazolonepropionase-like amidohydrolase